MKKKTINKDTRKKISRSLKEYFSNPKNRKRLSDSHKGKTLTEEHKRKIKESVKKWNKEVGMRSEIRKRIAEKQKGKKLSEETKRKIGLANKGNTAWNRGLTKEDPRVLLNSIKRAKTQKQMHKEGRLKPWNLGKHHSEETRKKISLQRKGKTYEEIMGKEKALQLKKRLSELGRMKTGEDNPMYGMTGEKNPHFGKPAKHGKHSFKRDLGHHCRSTWEANYARYLLWINKKYKYEPKTFTIRLPNEIKGTYTPDFLVNGNEWHEVKGWEDRNTIKKWKLFQQQYPEEKFILIDRIKYKKIEKLFKYIIPNWEF